MLLKLLMFFMITQTVQVGSGSTGGTVPGTYPPVPQKYWVPVRRGAPPAKEGGGKAGQSSGGEAKQEGGGASFEESPVDLLSPEERVSIMGGRRYQLPQFHVVRAGETLWDIASTYFGDPWEWPKLWAMNPHITNPHWLFPGTKVYLSEASARRSPSGGSLPAAGTKPVERFVGLRLSDVDESVRNLAVVDGDATRAGTIESSVDGRTLISMGDEVYVKDLSKEYSTPGLRLGIYRVLGDIKDPDSGAVLGKVVRICGEGEVQRHGNGRVVVKITDSIAAIGRGDFVGPVPHKFLDVRITQAPQKKIRATLAKGFLNKIMFSAGDIVVLSVGRDQGVEPGMPFTIAVRGTGGMDRDILPMEKRNVSRGDEYPWEVEGRGIVLYSKGGLSLGIIRRSYLPIRIGDDVLFGPWEGLR